MALSRHEIVRIKKEQRESEPEPVRKKRGRPTNAEVAARRLAAEDAERIAKVSKSSVDLWNAHPNSLIGREDLRTKRTALFRAPDYWQFLGTRANQPFEAFPKQKEILSDIRVPWPGNSSSPDPHAPGHLLPYPRIWAVNCGRRFSKTTIGEKLLWQGLFAPDDFFGPPAVRLTADTTEHAMKIWRLFIWHLESTPLKALLKDYSKEFMRVEMQNGATAQLFSADNPRALSGDGVSLWIIDEAQFVSQEAFDNLFPSTAERNGIIVMLGVSEGDGPFREVSFRGEDLRYPEFCRLTAPTAANPFVPQSAIDFAARTQAPQKFRQLYLAQWVNELGAVFRNIDGCIDRAKKIRVAPEGYAFTDLPLLGHQYYGGLDLARLSDWTVFTIWDRMGALVAWDRFSQIEWELQKDRIARLSAEYGHPPTAVDTTGVGDPIPPDLMKKGMRVVETKITTNTIKNAMIDEFAIRLGASMLSFPDIPEFVQELRRYEAKRSKSGSFLVYGAPSGVNDDFVMSAALASTVLPRPASGLGKVPSKLAEFNRQQTREAISRRRVAPYEYL